MSYIGSPPSTQSFAPGTDTFSGDGTTVAFTLSRNVGTVNDILVVVNNVDQQPTAYSVSVSTLTFTAAPSAGTNNIYVRYLSTNLQTIAPQQGSVYPASMSTGGPSWNSSGNVTATGNVIASSFTSASTFGFKNRLINGGFGIWQRGTSGFTTLSNYCADRWFVSSGGSLSAVSRSTDVPTGFQYSLSVTGTNVQSIGQRIESVNCTDLVGHNVTVSFWAKQTSGAGSNSISLQLWYANTPDTFGSITQIGSTGTFNGTSSWAQYSITFSSLPANVVNGVLVVLYSGGSSTILVTGVQLEKGSTATSFDYRPYGTELALCQRYYYQSTNYASASFTYLQADFLVYGPLSAAGNWLWTCQRLQVPMRVAPTVTTSDQAGTTGKVSLWTTTAGSQSNGTTPYTVYTSVNSYTVSVYTESKYGFFGAIKADAEL